MKTTHWIVLISLVLIACLIAACNGIALIPPTAENTKGATIDTEAETANAKSLDVLGEMVSTIVDAPGSAATPEQGVAAQMDIFGEMVSMIVDAPGSSITVKIANAMSAAPMAISKDATILDFPANAGEPMVVLRQGTNGWTCYADWPASPGNDPECNDPVAEGWLSALFAGKEAPPEITAPGIAYMLMGGSDPSNADPMAAGPAPGDDWISTPGHVMLLVPGGFDAADFATEPKQDEPYIMWDGTPYEHLMIPVVPMQVGEMGAADAELRKTMGAAPAGIVSKAKIMGNPTTEGGDMVTLQEGDSGWVCWPDRLVSPGNDPACNDPVWEALFATAEPQPVERAGVSYMLAGGSDESNTDPMATGPAPGEDWITTPPHLMLLVPGGFDAKLFTTDHTSGFPYIMWDGTPYEHLMVPVADMSK